MNDDYESWFWVAQGEVPSDMTVLVDVVKRGGDKARGIASKFCFEWCHPYENEPQNVSVWRYLTAIDDDVTEEEMNLVDLGSTYECVYCGEQIDPLKHECKKIPKCT